MTKRTPRTIDVLKYARDLLEKGWCKGWSAKIDGKFMTEITSHEATHFCARGSIQRAYLDLGASEKIFGRAQDKLININKIKPTLVQWNDSNSRTKEEVLKAFDKAIKG